MKTFYLIRFSLACMLAACYLSTFAQTNINVNAVKSLNNSSNVAKVFSTAKMTGFVPATHGFKFSNTFSSSLDVAGINGLRLGGLCGGMAYSALDYYKNNIPVPTQKFRPANRTPLQSYIYNRQVNSLERNADKWTELIVNPFGWRTNEFFNWGLQGTNGGRIQELKEMIDKGSPVPLGLFKAGSGGITPHHQVLAIGYDMGRYKGDLGEFKEDLKIFIYDPNHPGETVTLRPHVSSLSYSYDQYPGDSWLTYFVDKKYTPSVPPRISTTALPNDGLVRELVIEMRTGGDDLRGGNDNVSGIVRYTDGTSDTYENLNKSARWIDNYCETVVISLRKPAALNMIKCVSLKTSFGGGIGGDNWNLDGLLIIAKDGNNENLVYAQGGAPLVRFDGNNRPFDALFR